MKLTAEFVWTGALLVAAGAAVIAGCAGRRTDGASAGMLPAREEAGGADAGQKEGALELSGSELWAQNCARCHNNRSPSDYSDAQWEVAVMHMRVQARLTGEEERKIVQFLKASN